MNYYAQFSTLDAYLDKTRSLRGSIDDIYIVLTGSIRPASPRTLAVWIRKFMTEAGLGGFTIHSTRSASSTAGLLAGIPIDELISRVGWKHPSTFINYYLKPLPQFKKHFKNNGTTFGSSTRSHYMPALPSTSNESLVSDFQDIWKGHRVTRVHNKFTKAKYGVKSVLNGPMARATMGHKRAMKSIQNSKKIQRTRQHKRVTSPSRAKVSDECFAKVVAELPRRPERPKPLSKINMGPQFKPVAEGSCSPAKSKLFDVSDVTPAITALSGQAVPCTSMENSINSKLCSVPNANQVVQSSTAQTTLISVEKNEHDEGNSSLSSSSTVSVPPDNQDWLTDTNFDSPPLTTNISTPEKSSTPPGKDAVMETASDISPIQIDTDTTELITLNMEELEELGIEFDFEFLSGSGNSNDSSTYRSAPRDPRGTVDKQTAHTSAQLLSTTSSGMSGSIGTFSRAKQTSASSAVPWSVSRSRAGIKQVTKNYRKQACRDLFAHNTGGVSSSEGIPVIQSHTNDPLARKELITPLRTQYCTDFRPVFPKFNNVVLNNPGPTATASSGGNSPTTAKKRRKGVATVAQLLADKRK